LATEYQLLENSTRNYTRLRRLRQVVQLSAFLLFLYLLLDARQATSTLLPHDLFFRLDPLVGITAMLASKGWIASMALSGLTLILAFVTGRTWCSWLCPVGTLLDWTPARSPQRNGLDVRSRWRWTKYLVLLTALLGGFLGSLVLLVFDPMTLLFRPVSSAVMPGFSSIITAVERQLYSISFLHPAVDVFDSVVRGSLLTEQPFFAPNLILISLLLGLLALNTLRPRFWCRYLCPLGALLGCLSKFAPIRYKLDSERCTRCQHCAKICPTGAINAQDNFECNSTECTVCLDCMYSCPTKAITFRSRFGLATHQPYNPQRRQLLMSLGSAIIGATLLHLAPGFPQKKPLLIRPPGTSEKELLSKCIRCGECARVCPTGTIQPSLSPAHLEGLWTPALETRLGYCDYACTSCGQVCPTGAIAKLSFEQKQRTIIGTAQIDKNRCTPYAEGGKCIVCEEMCPVPQKAIRLDEKTILHPSGEISRVL
jgi:polyferredoxin